MPCSGYMRKGWLKPFLGFTGLAFAKYFLRHASRNNSVSKAAKNISKHYDLVSRLCLFSHKNNISNCSSFFLKLFFIIQQIKGMDISNLFPPSICYKSFVNLKELTKY